ncbi:MAG: precorrin-6y C5,15-methyltransferase (decarboxylating) subunit CbiE [Deltaproteobacteria bacterium]|jgi:precorrin-6Y C5,15-methyltransferase (decarboxylating)|nr:precorrin-6y C5,15-methyltransferase (decarboxylating) subunit CbiE [Deltaproteobacteria bacterium]
MLKRSGIRRFDEPPDDGPAVTILGIDDPGDLCPSAAALLEGATLVAGPARLLGGVLPRLNPRCRTIPLAGGLGAWLSEVRESFEAGGTVILADGDPNFFGLGARVIGAFAGHRVAMRPAPTAVQKAFALMGVSWAGVEVVSLHGRNDRGAFYSALFRAGQPTGPGRLAVYTDPVNGPAAIASAAMARGQLNWKITVFQDLGLPGQRIWSGDLAKAAKTEFSPLNLVVLERLGPQEALSIGSPESAYDHEAGLITKSEVRTAALGLLELGGDETMWDLGCGSGSVSLEAALLLRHGRLLAVERDPRRAAQARENRSRYGTAHLEIIEGPALEVIPDLPAPDRVFVGGGGRQLEALLQGVLGFMAPGGVAVVAVVRLDSLDAAISSLSRTGLPISVTQISAARGEPLADSLLLKPINPVFLVKGRVPK